jgi:hypothetical protein
MKRAVLLLAALALALAACTNSFTPTAMTAEKTAAEATAKATVTPISAYANIDVSFSDLTYGLTGQKLVISFTGANLSAAADVTNLASALAVYKLGATAAADGAYSRGAALSLGTPEVSYTGGATVVIYTLSLTGDTAISDQVEVAIAGDKLTAAGGNKILDLDGDKVAGEAGDDDYIKYIGVGGAPVTALGAARDPLASLGGLVVNGASITNASTVVTFSALTTVGLVPANVDLSVLSTAVGLQKWNATSSTWDAVTGTTPAYNGTTGVYSITLGTAMALGEVYRVVYTNPSNIAEKAAVRGYIHRWSYNNKLTTSYSASTYPTGAPANQSGATYDATAFFDSNNRNGYVLVAFMGLGAQGIDTTTISNIKLYDSTLNAYVPVSSIKAATSYGSTVYVSLTLASSYTMAGHNFIVLVGPNVKDLGATTASTDDRVMGTYNNVTVFPYGYTRVTGGASAGAGAVTGTSSQI